MSRIKGLRRRLKSMLFKYKFLEQHEETKVDLASGIQACIDVKKSEKFQRLLEILLLTGNILNTGSANLESSIGFDLKFLPNFYGTKTNDNKRTLLHMVAQIVADKHPNLLNFVEEFDTFLESASKSSFFSLFFL